MTVFLALHRVPVNYIIALTRPGWDRDNAEAWADGIADDALCSNPDLTPTHVAQTDVIECEWESANAG